MSEVLYLKQTFINCVFDMNVNSCINKMSGVTTSYGTLPNLLHVL